MELVTPKFSGEASLPYAPVNIMPLGDIQYTGDGEADVAHLSLLRKYVKHGMAHNAYFIGMGDYIDFMSPSNRERLSMAKLYDTATKAIDHLATDLEEVVFKILEPSKGRWLGLVEGHHHYVHLDGTTTGQRLAARMGTTYGGDSMMMRVRFKGPNTSTATTTFFIHHGEGGSSALAGPLAKLERFAAHCDAQVFFIGHHHKQMVTLFDSLSMTTRGKPVLYHTTRAIVLTGSFLRGWMQGSEVGGRPTGGYVEKGMMSPLTLGAPMITLAPKQINGGPSVVDVGTGPSLVGVT